MNDDDQITTIKITKRNIRQLMIIKAIERRSSYNEVITYLLNKYYDDWEVYNDFFEQKPWDTELKLNSITIIRSKKLWLNN